MFSDRVQKYKRKLNETDMLILRYLLDNRNEIKETTIKQIADDNFISMNTVVRFAKKLQYDSFTDLKYALYYNSIVKERTPLELDQVQCEHPSIDRMVQTSKLLDENKLISIANDLFLTENCYTFGIGDSSYYSYYLSKCLMGIGKKIEVLDKMYQVENVVNNKTEDDIIIFVSASGETAEVKMLVDSCLENNVEMVVVTGSDDNYLNTKVDKSILFKYDMIVQNGVNTSDLAGMLFAINKFVEIYSQLFYTDKK